MYCKNCKISFPGNKPYCSQCGSELLSDLDITALRLFQGHTEAFDQIYYKTQQWVRNNLSHKMPLHFLDEGTQSFYENLGERILYFNPDEERFTKWFARFLNEMTTKIARKYVGNFSGRFDSEIRYFIPDAFQKEFIFPESLELTDEERIQMLNAIMGGVDEEERICITLKYLKHLSEEEIADCYDASVDAIGQTIASGTTKIQRNIQMNHLLEALEITGMTEASLAIWLLRFNDFSRGRNAAEILIRVKQYVDIGDLTRKLSKLKFQTTSGVGQIDSIQRKAVVKKAGSAFGKTAVTKTVSGGTTGILTKLVLTAGILAVTGVAGIAGYQYKTGKLDGLPFVHQGNQAENNKEDNTGDMPADKADNNGNTGEPQEEGNAVEEETVEEAFQGIFHPIRSTYEQTGMNSGRSMKLAYVKADKIALNTEEAVLYPKLQQTLQEEAYTLEQTANNRFREDYPKAKEAYARGWMDIGMTYIYELNVNVVRADEMAFSLQYINHQYSGGAHGTSSTTGKNYDVKTGKEIELHEVVKDYDQLLTVLREKLQTLYGDHLDVDLFSRYMESAKSDQSKLCWTLGYNGIMFYFNEYEIASWGSGMMTVFLEFEEYPDVLQASWKSPMQSYAIPLMTGYNNFVDVNRDGRVERLVIEAYKNGDNAFDNANIYIDGNQTSLGDIYYYSLDPYYVHTDNIDALYFFAGADNDYQLALIYPLKDGTLERNGYTMDLGRNVLAYRSYDGEDGDSWGFERQFEEFIDPARVTLETRLDALSTLTGEKTYHVDNKGIVTSDDNAYRIAALDEDGETREHVFTTKKELTLDKVDAKGSIGEAATLSKGTRLIYIRTDNQRWADFRLEDGSMVRGTVNLDGYPQLLNGEDIEQVLDGVMFSG